MRLTPNHYLLFQMERTALKMKEALIIKWLPCVMFRRASWMRWCGVLCVEQVSPNMKSERKKNPNGSKNIQSIGMIRYQEYLRPKIKDKIPKTHEAQGKFAWPK